MSKDLQLKFFFEEFKITLLLFICFPFKCLLVTQESHETLDCAAPAKVSSRNT